MGIAKINDQRLCGTGGHAMSSMQVLLIMPMLLHITAAASSSTVRSLDDYVDEYYGGDKDHPQDENIPDVVPRIEDAPFIVAFIKGPVYRRRWPPLPVCTGTIIAPEWVLTSANVVRAYFMLGSTLVIAGARYSSEFKNASETLNTTRLQRRLVQHIYSHPEYKDGNHAYDVSVVQVDPFVFNSHVNKIGIRVEKWANQGESSYGVQKCTSGGWGPYAAGEYSRALRTTSVEARRGVQACPCHGPIHRRLFICAAGKTDGSLCYGHTGSPLVCDGLLAGIWFGRRNGKKCKKPSISCKSADAVFSWLYVCPVLEFLAERVPGLPSSCLEPEPEEEEEESYARNIPPSSPNLVAALGLFLPKVITAINCQP